MYREIARVIRTRPLSSLAIFCDYLEERGKLHLLEVWWHHTVDEFMTQRVAIAEELLLSGEVNHTRQQLSKHDLRDVIEEALEEKSNLEELLWHWLYLRPCPEFVHRVACDTLAREFPMWGWRQFPPPAPACACLELLWE